MSDMRTPAASLSALAALSAGAAAIHFGVMSSHLGMSLTHGVFFAVVGSVQLAWAAAVLARARRGVGQEVLLAGAFFNLAVLIVWLVGTTAGLPFGPGAWVSQPIGAPDLLGAVLEVMLIAGALVLAERETPRSETTPGEVKSARSGLISAAGLRAVLSRARHPLVKRLGVAVLSALVAVAVVASFNPSISASVSTTLAALAAKADNSDAPAGHHHHHHGPVAAMPNAQSGGNRVGAARDAQTGEAQASEAETAAADALVRVALDEVPKRWPTAHDAEKDGYRAWTEASGVRQLAKPELIDDGVILDPTRPEALIYYDKPDGSSVLLGLVYILPPDLPAPVIGGPLTPWYLNPTPCLPDLCGSDQGGLSQMLRIWLVDYPGGPFAAATSPSLEAAIAQLEAGY